VWEFLDLLEALMEKDEGEVDALLTAKHLHWDPTWYSPDVALSAPQKALKNAYYAGRDKQEAAMMKGMPCFSKFSKLTLQARKTKDSVEAGIVSELRKGEFKVTSGDTAHN
jgi:hypothetical protein